MTYQTPSRAWRFTRRPGSRTAVRRRRRRTPAPVQRDPVRSRSRSGVAAGPPAQPWVVPAPRASGRRSRQAAVASARATSSRPLTDEAVAAGDAERACGTPAASAPWQHGRRAARRPTQHDRARRRLGEQLGGVGDAGRRAKPTPERTAISASATAEAARRTRRGRRPSSAVDHQVADQVGHPGVRREVERGQRAAVRCPWSRRPARAGRELGPGRRRAGRGGAPSTSRTPGGRRSSVVDHAEHADHRRGVDVGAARTRCRG